MPIQRSPTNITGEINNCSVTFQLDSGSYVSCISLKDVLKVQSKVNPTCKRILAYSGDEVKILGEYDADFIYNNACIKHTFLVVPCKNVNLLGRDLCQKIGINFTVEDPNTVCNIQPTSVFEKFRDYLSDDYKSSMTTEVQLKVAPDYKPVFSKARPVPLKLQDMVKAELLRLEEAGTITKVFSSETASPIVCLMKANRDNVRICVDYSQTVNPFIEPVNTKLPSIEEVISQVGQTRVYSKLDCSDAFLQLKSIEL